MAKIVLETSRLLLCEWDETAFAHSPDERIVTLTVAQNTPSWGLMERLGMTRRPAWDHHDPRYSDELNPTIVYAIERNTLS